MKEFKKRYKPSEYMPFIELYPSDRMHYEALTELAMIGDLYRAGYKDLGIFLKSWNIEEDSVHSPNTIESKWISFVRSFFFQRYAVPVNKIDIFSPDSFLKEMDSKSMVELITESGLDFQDIGKLFAQQEYWPWKFDKDGNLSDKHAIKAKKEGLLSYIGLMAIEWKWKNNGADKQPIVIRAASAKEITDQIMAAPKSELKHLKIFYTDDDVSRSKEGQESFLKKALEMSKHYRKDLRAPNDESDNILNHYDENEVVDEVVGFLLDPDRDWGDSGVCLSPFLFNRDRISPKLIQANKEEVLKLFEEYKNTDPSTPVLGSYEFWKWLQDKPRGRKKRIDLFRTLVDTYQNDIDETMNNGKDADSAINEGFRPVNDLDDKLENFVREWHDAVVASAWDEHTIKEIQRYIIEFKKIRTGVPGRPPLHYKLPSDTPKIEFQIYVDKIVNLHHPPPQE